MLVQFPKRHVRASTGSRDRCTERAASAVIISAVIPAWRATAVPRTVAHHSEGILSRRRHLETIEYVAPMSDTAASMEGHRSITALNEAGFDIESLLGQSGLYGKANVARDGETHALEDGDMQRLSKTETQEKYAFIARVKLARMSRFGDQKPICTILGIEQGSYKHYEVRTPLPHRFIPKFVAACGVTFEWLLAADGKAPVALPEALKPKRTLRKTRTKAA